MSIVMGAGGATGLESTAVLGAATGGGILLALSSFRSRNNTDFAWTISVSMSSRARWKSTVADSNLASREFPAAVLPPLDLESLLLSLMALDTWMTTSSSALCSSASLTLTISFDDSIGSKLCCVGRDQEIQYFLLMAKGHGIFDSIEIQLVPSSVQEQLCSVELQMQSIKGCQGARYAVVSCLMEGKSWKGQQQLGRRCQVSIRLPGTPHPV